MSRAIRYWKEEDVEPWPALDWETIKSFLWIGYDICWAKGQQQGNEYITKGIQKDALEDVTVIYEFFPHLIWTLMQEKKITVTEEAPHLRPPDFGEVHKNLFLCLASYSRKLDQSYPERMEAWRQVDRCLQRNGFDKPENQKTICEAVYNGFAGFIRKARDGSNALMLTKAHIDVDHRDENGGFAKSNCSSIPASEVSPQMWLVNFGPNDTEATRSKKSQCGVRAIFLMAAGETPRKPPPQWSQFGTPYYLTKGTTVKLLKPVETGGMVSFQSSSWEWHTSRSVNDNTTLNLHNNAGDFLLHISLRQSRNAVVLNSRHADGNWGHEEAFQLRDTFVGSNFSISVRIHHDGYELLFSYQPAAYYKRRIPGVVSSVSYNANIANYSPLSETLIVSVFDSIEQLTQTNQLANCETPGDSFGSPNARTITTRPAFKRGANFAAAPGKKKKDNLGFEYAEHCYLGDAITLTIQDKSTVTAKDHTFTLENQLTVTYGQISSLAGDFYGTHEPISDGFSDEDQVDLFVKAYNTLASRYAGQPAEAIEILKIIKKEISAVNDALANHENPSEAYNSLPDETWAYEKLTMYRRGQPSYLGLAWHNWDHFGEDARTAYNAGHSKALEVAIAGDLEKAYAMNAFADHFLEDLFSAGHLRTPRRLLHSDKVPIPDYCAKLMYDEDNAIGLSVTNPNGETWTVYGDKYGLDPENDENKRRCVKALQTSANEVYMAWKKKKQPSKYSYGAWAHAPTLESARGEQALAPLIRDGKRRAALRKRDTWSFTESWTCAGTVLECANSGWWTYPITIDGPSGPLRGSDIAVTATDSMKCKVYYQDAQGVVCEYVNDSGWTATSSPTFSAKMFSPLAVVSFDLGKQIHAYCVSDEDYLQEWCCSNGRDWEAGDLTKSTIRVAANTKLAAVCWYNEGPNIRLYAQEPNTDKIQEYCYGTSWVKGAVLPLAHTGTSLAAVCSQDGAHIRVYYQAPNRTIREHCWDGSWSSGTFHTDKMPRRSSIAAVGWGDSSTRLRVYCHNARKSITEFRWNGEWTSDGTVLEPLGIGRCTSAFQWDGGSCIRFYYQGDDDELWEQCQNQDGPWFTGAFNNATGGHGGADKARRAIQYTADEYSERNG